MSRKLVFIGIPLVAILGSLFFWPFLRISAMCYASNVTKPTLFAYPTDGDAPLKVHFCAKGLEKNQKYVLSLDTHGQQTVFGPSVFGNESNDIVFTTDERGMSSFPISYTFQTFGQHTAALESDVCIGKPIPCSAPTLDIISIGANRLI